MAYKTKRIFIYSFNHTIPLLEFYCFRVSSASCILNLKVPSYSEVAPYKVDFTETATYIPCDLPPIKVHYKFSILVKPNLKSAETFGDIINDLILHITVPVFIKHVSV